MGDAAGTINHAEEILLALQPVIKHIPNSYATNYANKLK